MRILVPIDGTAASRRAVRFATSLASAGADVHVILLNVQNRGTLGLSELGAEEPPDEARQAQRASDKVLGAAAALCREAAVSYETMAETGPAADTIARVARDQGVDQIVMGTRGLNSLTGLLLGSVTTRTVHLADVPVTLIK
ncbi:universal stress protein [Rhodopila sp.]|jgi:nucleotide-binding universal stress UspA family protein|uniref:universal stress protein n=1 Tax=Rhodopila sp. TaxID=2480087 RepID=UPI002C85C516|nr:universal stress protein [Rhodopila sp.]HVZ08077.1 universal stress protein [Rhodopila sp.]